SRSSPACPPSCWCRCGPVPGRGRSADRRWTPCGLLLSCHAPWRRPSVSCVTTGDEHRIHETGAGLAVIQVEVLVVELPVRRGVLGLDAGKVQQRVDDLAG